LRTLKYRADKNDGNYENKEHGGVENIIPAPFSLGERSKLAHGPGKHASSSVKVNSLEMNQIKAPITYHSIEQLVLLPHFVSDFYRNLNVGQGTIPKYVFQGRDFCM
jgi:hypothetical protein